LKARWSRATKPGYRSGIMPRISPRLPPAERSYSTY
jgi:hypothetical protein